MRGVKKDQVRIRLKMALLKKNLSITDLADQIEHPRPNVSKAINHGKFPRILAKIQEVLCA